LAARPDDAEARNNLGAVFMAQGKLAEAIDQFQQALAIKPDHAEAHYNLGSGCEIWVNRSRQ
jgi:Flp pilus assembly protein TadD